MSACTLLLLAAAFGQGAPRVNPADDPRALVERALREIGGAKRVQRYAALTWRGRAVVHLPDGRVELQGQWRLLPPDRARVETQDLQGTSASLRRLIIDGPRGWGEAQGHPSPLPRELVAHERDQFYLYHLMRLAPLLEPGFTLTALGRGADSLQGVRVTHAGRPDVSLFFDDKARLARLESRVTDPGSGNEMGQVATTSGVIEGAGLRWPRRIEMTWDGKPYFDVELLEFLPLPGLPDSVFRP
jgi:hypothetical protein